MKFKVLFLFLINFSKSFGSISNVNLKDYNTLTYGIKIIAEKVVPDVATILNIVSISNNYESNDFKDVLLKKLMESLKLRFRQQDMENVKPTGLRGARRFSFIPIRHFADFKIFHKKLNPTIFHFNGYYIFSLINGEFPEVQTIFDDLWELQIYNVILIYAESHDHLSVVSFLPFRSSTDCSNTSPAIINEFIDGNFTHDVSDTFNNKMENLQQCEIRVATSDDKPPHIYRKSMPNGISKFYGRDFELINSIAESLNFKVNLNVMKAHACVVETRGVDGGLKSILQNKSELAITGCWLRLSKLNEFASTTSYAVDTFIIAFPIMQELTSFEKLFYPLAMSTWILLISYISVGYISIFIIKRQSRKIQNFVIGRNVKYPYFNMLIAILGLSQNRLPMRNFARFLLMNFLILCLVLRTAYQGKLFQVMKASVKHSEPKTISEMERLGYKFHALEVHTEYVNDSGKFTIM